MKSSFSDLCSEFTKRARYNLALIPTIPNEKIMKVLEQDGYKLVPHVPSKEEISGMMGVMGHGVPYLPPSTIKNRDGADVITGDRATYDQFRQDVRRAAAQVYGIKP